MNFVYLIESAINSKRYAEADRLVRELVRTSAPISHSQASKIAILLASNSQEDSAIFLLKKLSGNGKRNSPLIHLLGKIFFSIGLHKEAKDCLEKTLLLTQNSSEVLFDLANVFSAIENHTKAIEIFTGLIDKQYRLVDVYFNRGNSFMAMGCYAESLEDFISSSKLLVSADVLNNIGFLLRKLNKIDEAIDVLSDALTRFGHKRNIILNRAACFYDLKSYKSSVDDLMLGISLYPNYPNLYDALGMSYLGLEDYVRAKSAFEKLIELNSDYPFAYGKLHSVKIKMCDWVGDGELIDALKSGLLSNKRVSMPFHVLGVIDDQNYQFLASQIWANEKFSNIVERLLKKNPNSGRKIKVGYFSADFHSHATMHLIEDLFRFHDLDSFEIYAFSSGGVLNDVVKERVKCYFNDFFDIDKVPDHEVIELCNRLSLDIAVDLKGYTQDSRLNLFANRVAPIQISYLGYPGTMGKSFMDYIIADKCVIPDKNQNYFSEKIIYLSGCYQINSENRLKKLQQELGAEKKLHVRRDNFIFASFNNQYKVRPEIYAAWMTILKAVPNSSLMIYADNEVAIENLKSQALQMGVLESRLIFISRVSQDEHIARQTSVDLCLDTFPYGGHTTCSDALGQGVLYLSLCGESFPSRVSASILKALNMSELVTYSLDEYIERAISIGLNQDLFISLKSKLETEMQMSSLFKPKLFVEELEAIYKELVF
jgi:protein O-GlcNAc transferase